MTVADADEEYHNGWVAGWDAHESFIIQQILDDDPGFQRWLDRLQAEGQRLREQQIIDEAAEEAARRTEAGLPLI